MRIVFFLLFMSLCCGCTYKAETEKYQTKRDRIVNVHNSIKEIKIEEPLINENSSLYLIDKYLIIGDYKSLDKIIHLFDRNNFKYITSISSLGQGPGEIANLGYIGVNNADREFYVTDHGKQKIFSYKLDSVIANPSYIPEMKMEIKENQFPTKYQYINDTLCIGIIIEPVGNANFKPTVAKWNMNTGEIRLMQNYHPDISKKRINLGVSMHDSLYAECYTYHDLITICDLDGNLKYNIYGPNWANEGPRKIHYYDDIIFCKSKIVAAYSGGDNLTDAYYPTKFMVFDLNGNYIKTLETGYMIFNICYDKDNERIIMSLNDEIQFAYLEMDNLI
ncbi:6-bladed beta-propeller [Parabacteroides bouchesdurhonensis]|uniref:6-bladed beta-propeller n=1 Tax=Parabacteroides bouchesdurhonensis TaxID=1936995 RepID=UPI000C8613D9|nr:6-bladed beta-propeller [Parabacteroides bouchesdurhonensis]